MFSYRICTRSGVHKQWHKQLNLMLFLIQKQWYAHVHTKLEIFIYWKFQQWTVKITVLYSDTVSTLLDTLSHRHDSSVYGISTLSIFMVYITYKFKKSKANVFRIKLLSRCSYRSVSRSAICKINNIRLQKKCYVQLTMFGGSVAVQC